MELLPFPVPGEPSRRMMDYVRRRGLTPAPWSVVSGILALAEGPAYDLLILHGIADDLGPPAQRGPGAMRQVADFQDVMADAARRMRETGAAVSTPLHYLWAATTNTTSETARILRERGVTPEVVAAVPDTDADGPPASLPELENYAAQIEARDRELASRRHLAIVIPVNAIAARGDYAAAVVQSVTVFPHGMSVALRVIARRGEDVSSPLGQMPDWSVDAEIDGAWVTGEMRGGQGGEDEWTQESWFPLPTQGVLTFRVRGGNGALEGTVEIDGAAVLDAAGGCEPLWPADNA